MPKPLLRIGHCLLIVAMFAACGGHWLVLQSVAWGGMIVEYSRTEGLTAAVERTFDGQHPCGLCKDIQKGKGSEEKPEAQVVVKKMELFCPVTAAFIVPPMKARLLVVADRFAGQRAEEPPVRPPRFVRS